MFDSVLVIYALVFAAALLAVDALLRVALASRRSSQEVRNRLEAIKLKHGNDEAYQQLLLRRGVPAGMGETIGSFFERIYAQTGLEISMPRRIVYFLSVILAGFAFISFVITPDPLIAMAGALVFAVAFSVFLLIRLRTRRIQKFTSQLAPAIDIMVRSLNAGHPLNSAISLVAREMPDPAGSEFGILSDQMTFGSDLDAGMMMMIDRVGAPELKLLATTVTVHKGTGGNLSEILENLAQMIRDRLMLKAKIRAISAEGRFTMWFMLAFPFLLFAMINFLRPDYFDPVWESGNAWLWISICLVVMAIGGVIIRRLVNFDF